ncbi:MAG TPA: hypothetical protein VJT49_09415 [Amycolatopsis sp.]|uniref:hypothetical protein n=1 Tax=Amycolatopsis sp. TaxID=37632 RepID=UPI002B489ABB|nr:hypothetical protein [Amycolatopsis sp.]HKS45317.1 hypothetical protein [Amycolatopsis sp.]
MGHGEVDHLTNPAAVRIETARDRDLEYLSTDPQFAAKVRDGVGPNPAAPENALVLEVDENPRYRRSTGPSRSCQSGHTGAHDPRLLRHGTTSLFATTIGSAIAQHHRQRHRYRYQNSCGLGD